MVEPDRIKLKSFKFEAKNKANLLYNYSKVDLEDFNLVIGDNAQGKTRLFRIFNFIKNQLSGDVNKRTIPTEFSAKFNFDLENNGKEGKIDYEINIIHSNGINHYLEELKRDNRVILSTKNKHMLFDEAKKETLEKFFLPQNIPAISAITDNAFPTIKIIREFFSRMLFIDADRKIEVNIDENAMILNTSCSNLGSVLLNWKNKKPAIYNELVSDFKSCFSIVNNLAFLKKQIAPHLQPELLALNEKDIKEPIWITDWSTGMWRLLSILSLPKTQFSFNKDNKKTYPPSMIFIDELENCLDFKTLGFVIQYLKDYSDDIQIIVSSHSPSISEFIHPRNWHIIKRKGAHIKITKPQNVEKNLDEKLDLFRQSYWDFYTTHINRSELYE